LSLSFSPPPLPLEIQECKHPKRNQRSNPPSTSPLPTTNYHPLQNAATQINQHPQKPHRKTPQTKTKLATTHKAFFLLAKNSCKTYKTTFRSEPKRKEGSKEGRKEVRLNGIQPAKPKGGIAGEERSKTMKREKDQTGECVKWKTKTTKNTYNKSNKRIV
jgi:hypothetical protein